MGPRNFTLFVMGSLLFMNLTVLAQNRNSMGQVSQAQEQSNTVGFPKAQILPRQIVVEIRLVPKPGSKMTSQQIQEFNLKNRFTLQLRDGSKMGNANGGGGGSYVVEKGQVHLSDSYQISKNHLETKNAAVAPEWMTPEFLSQLEIIIDPDNDLLPEEKKTFTEEIQKNGSFVFQMLFVGSNNTIDTQVRFSDQRYSHLGQNIRFHELPFQIQEAMTRIRIVLENKNLFNDRFWDHIVAGPQVNYRIVSQNEFMQIECPKYLPEIGDAVESHQQFGCTYDHSTYIVRDFITANQSDPTKIALALVHERLWALDPSPGQQTYITVFISILENLMREASSPDQLTRQDIQSFYNLAQHFGFVRSR